MIALAVIPQESKTDDPHHHRAMEERIYATGTAYRLRSQWDREDGLGQNHKAVKFLGQDFERLRSQSLQSGRLFEDNLFPSAASSLGFNELGPRSSKTYGVRWIRPPVRDRGDGGGRVRDVTVCKLPG